MTTMPASPRQARLSKDHRRVQCGWCGGRICTIAGGSLFAPPGWHKGHDGIFEPTERAQDRYGRDRAQATGNDGRPETLARDARGRLQQQRSTRLRRPLSGPGMLADDTYYPEDFIDVTELPVRVRCIRCGGVSEVSTAAFVPWLRRDP